MRSKRRAMRRSRPPEYDLDVTFEAGVRAVPGRARADILAWLRNWRHQPGRVFWVMDGVGRWRLLP